MSPQIPYVRRALAGDAAHLARLYETIQSWHATHYPKAFFAKLDPVALEAHFRAKLQDPDTFCFLACLGPDSPPMGYALCALQSRGLSLFSPPVKRLMIEHIAVAAAARRKGLAAALFTQARLLAKEQNCDEILLDTWAQNHEAHAFFRQMGFAPRRMLFHAHP